MFGYILDMCLFIAFMKTGYRHVTCDMNDNVDGSVVWYGVGVCSEDLLLKVF